MNVKNMNIMNKVGLLGMTACASLMIGIGLSELKGEHVGGVIFIGMGLILLVFIIKESINRFKEVKK